MFRKSASLTFSRIPRPDLVPLYSWLGAAAGLALMLAVAASVAIDKPWLPAAGVAAVLATLWCMWRPVRWVYILIATIFLESASFSLFLGPLRIRSMQVLLLPALGVTVFYVCADAMRLRRIPLLVPILTYLGCNALSTILSPVPKQSMKVFVLLCSLAALYFVVYTLVREDEEAWPSVFRFFVIVGMLEVGFGLYQVAAGILNTRFGMSLPIGDYGIFHAQYLGTSFGRPYGTLPEADPYGAVCLFFALLLGLLWVTPSTRLCSNRLARNAAAAAVAGMLLSFVRASWFGFFVGLAWAALLRVSGRLRPIRAVRVWCSGVALMLVLAAAVIGSAEIRGVLSRRFDRGAQTGERSLSSENARFQQMRMSFDLFLQRPLFGNGTGSFAALGTFGAHEDYYLEQEADFLRMVYDPSILTTVLNDTGLLGVAAFIYLCAAYFDYVRRKSREHRDPRARNAALAAHCAWIGLFASFIFTQYFWMPFTWMFLAIVVLMQDLPLRNAHAEEVSSF